MSVAHARTHHPTTAREIAAYIVARVMPKMAQLITFPILPLSLHNRVHLDANGEWHGRVLDDGSKTSVRTVLDNERGLELFRREQNTTQTLTHAHLAQQENKKKKKKKKKGKTSLRIELGYNERPMNTVRFTGAFKLNK